MTSVQNQNSETQRKSQLYITVHVNTDERPNWLVILDTTNTQSNQEPATASKVMSY